MRVFQTYSTDDRLQLARQKRERLDEQRHSDNVVFSIMPQIKQLIHGKFDEARR